MSAWYEAFFNGLYSKVLPVTFDGPATDRQVAAVRRMLKLRKGQRVLDVPCGMGRLTIPMAGQGLRMTGADLTEGYLRRGRRQARKEGLDVRFVRSDMREIDFEDEFDAAFNWFGSFGYFPRAGNLKFCRAVLRALRPGGRFLIEGMNKSWMLSHFRASIDQSFGHVRVEHRNRFDHRTSRVQSVWTLHRGRQTETHRVSIWIFDGGQIRELLREAGFGEVRLYDGRNINGRFTRHSSRICAVATKPGRRCRVC